MAFDSPAVLPYAIVNRAVNEVIFDGRFKLAPVYLDIEGDVEADLAARLGLKPGECLQAIARAVAATMKWKAYDPFCWHSSELQTWNELERPEGPPFSALLAVLSLAAERMRADEDYSAQNYYERLFEVLEVETDSRKSALRQNAKSVLPFWLALNQWLAENDFEYGRPTAQQINSWQYAGYALSQALVRDADRKRLHGLFADYGLAPKETLTTAEMSLYLHEWMGGGAASAWLKKIWASPDLRPRVAEAACSELQAWEGESEATGQARRRLTWAAALQDFPPRLRLLLSASGSQADAEDVSALRLTGEVSPAAAAAFASCPDGVQLVPLASGDISAIEPVASLALSPLMLASFELEDCESGLRFQKAARAIIPLVKLDTGPFYREVSRLSFLRSHLVLCHVQWLKPVESHLTLNARQGFRILTPHELPGLAADWVLFTKVELLRAPHTTHANLQALVPLSEGVSVEASGGLRLAAGLWHSEAPPEITAAGLYAPMALQLQKASGETIAEVSIQATSCRLTLGPELELDATDLSLVVTEAGRSRPGASFSFRSGEHPRRLPQSAPPAFDLRPGVTSSLISAAPSLDFPGPWARGLLVEGVTLAGPQEVLPASPVLPAVTGEASAGEEEAYQLHTVDGLEETCVLRGYHYWDCQDFDAGDDPRDDKWMTCRSCANRVLTRNRGAAPKRRTAPGARRSVSTAAPSKPPGMLPRKPRDISASTVFDALCYLGQGSWSKFQDLAGAGGQPEFAVHRMAQDLFALGHIDLIYDSRLRTPVAWSVAPPVICLAEGGVFAAGFRNNALLEEMSRRLEPHGGILDVTPVENGPSRYFWKLPQPAAAAAAVEGLRDRHQRPVRLVQDAGLALASASPFVREIINAMPALRLESADDLQAFDLGRGVWRKADDASTPGAYRGGYGGRRYFFTAQDGSQTEGPYAVVKLAAARAQGLRLHSYDAARREFHSVAGCEPPGLLSRALASFTGLPPERVDGRVTYHGVPPEAAALVFSKLYG